MKKFVIFLLLILLLSGCTNNAATKVRLDSKYYNSGEFIEIDDRTIEKISTNSYILYTYNNYCNFAVPCENIFKEIMEKYKIDFVSIPFENFKKTGYYKTVKYAPSVIIIDKGEISAYLDAESDEDLDKYQDSAKFEEWLNQYIDLKNE